MLKEKLTTLPALYSTDELKGDLPAVYVFTPGHSATWVLWEYSPENDMAFGLCDLGLGFPEMGYVSIAELETLSGRLSIPIEVDTSITTRFQGYKVAGVPTPEYLMA